MADSSFGRVVLAAAWLGGGSVFVALALGGWTEASVRPRFLRFGVAWALFGVAQLLVGSDRFGSWTDRRASDWSRRRSALLGVGVALVVVGFVLSGTFLLGFGAGGLLLVAVAVLAEG